MPAPTPAVMVRATVVAVLLLMLQCCNVILAARPLLDGGDGEWQLGSNGGGALTAVQLLARAVGPGMGNPYDYQDPNYYQPPDTSLLP
ncbi:unnamed protein product [Urochloa decumbens]|uniref:Uncharacterized protein n=1 Tax=Urochloa decumbens TaxID=240449 RepID=A0ABC8XPP1_9POAL